VQTDKRAQFPIVLVDKTFWAPMMDFINNSLLKQYEYISPGDLGLFKLVDTADEAVSEILDFYSKYSLKPNF
jgi:predicted Rossmann-fold nucleotide-binding protein